jgi:hypothetical protein
MAGRTINIVNASSAAPVYRGDGLRLYGLDAEVERKVRSL